MAITSNRGGELYVELAAADSFDKLDIDGNITLGGTLNVSLLGGYSPADGATFDILDWTGTQNGTFFDIDLPTRAIHRLVGQESVSCLRR